MKDSPFMRVLLILCCASASMLCWAPPPEGQDSITRAIVDFQKIFTGHGDMQDKLIMSVQISTLEAQKAYHKYITLSTQYNETWDSLCIVVVLRGGTPGNAVRDKMPSTWYEFQVFYNTPYQQPPETWQNYVQKLCPVEKKVICSTLSLICPNGSKAKRTHECLYVCGAMPYGQGREQAYRMYDEFMRDYPGPFAFVTIQKLKDYDELPELNPTENLTNYSLEVKLRNGDNNMYPDVYNGIRIFYTRTDCRREHYPCEVAASIGCVKPCPEKETPFKPVMVIIVFIATLLVCYLVRRTCANPMEKGFTLIADKSKEDKIQHNLLKQVPVAPIAMPPVPVSFTPTVPSVQHPISSPSAHTRPDEK